MFPKKLTTIAHIHNETQREMRLHLEMIGAEIVLSPGHAVELLASPSNELLPVTIDYLEHGLQIHPYKEFDPNWHIRFKGKLIPAGYPTVLADYEAD